MKNKIISVLLILNLIITMGILNFFIKDQISKEKVVLKEMTESKQVSGMQTEINNLNKSHEEYANYIQTSKQKIANAINMYQNNNAIVDNSLEEFSTMITNLTNIPENTYYYEEGTEGDSTTIKRYKKIGDSYYVCDANGIALEGTTAADISSITLIPYNALVAENISAGFAGYASGSLYLGDSSDNTGYGENKVEVISYQKNTSATKSGAYFNPTTISEDGKYIIVATSACNATSSVTYQYMDTDLIINGESITSYKTKPCVVFIGDLSANSQVYLKSIARTNSDVTRQVSLLIIKVG